MARETLTKFDLNKKIVEMRKNVRQARIHCISKLCKEIKKLKNKKGSEEQVSKNVRKTDKLVQQMMYIKKVKPDVVSKFALQNEKSMTEICNDVNEPIETKALSRLANHKAINEKVVEFRNIFADWKKLLEPFLETLGEKYRNKSKETRKPRNPAKKVPQLTSQKICRNPENPNKYQKPDKPPSSLADVIRNSSGDWTVEIFETGESLARQLECTTNQVSRTTKNTGHVRIEKCISVNPKTTKNLKNSRPFEVEKDMNQPIIMKNNHRSFDPSSISNVEVSKTAVDIDPFFMTKDDKEYLSISARATDSQDIVSERDVPEITASNKPNQLNKKKKHSNFKSTFINGSQSNLKFTKNRFFDSASSKSNINEKIAGASLHPSWEAKKKLTSIVKNSQFQGKKIIFDE